MTQAIGWTAAVVLLVTIGWQVAKQWREHTSKGVSFWLFAGQIVANALFLTYAALTGDRVFLTANALLLITSAVGLFLKIKHERAATHADSKSRASVAKDADEESDVAQ